MKNSNLLKKPLFYFMFCLLGTAIHAQKVSNIAYRQEQTTIIVSYDLETMTSCKIGLYVSTNGGSSWQGPLTKVSGDVGDNITSGSHSITWYVLEEFEELRGDNIKFQVRAEESLKEQETHKLYSFSSLGIQSGTIAKYGLLFETHNKERFCGFHLAIRTSLTSKEAILNGTSKANKIEIDLGPNFKISESLYLNIGFGYGYFNYANRNDFAGILATDKKSYLLSSLGLMTRLSNIININGGASFMVIDKDFYKPELIFGVSFNLIKNRN